MSLQSVRGTHDLLPEIQSQHNLVIETARQCAELFGFSEMSTPIFEFSSVFKRTLGEESDIVNKEMYTFTDRNGEELTLRPEGTASIARAFISEGLSQRTPLKVFYQGPMFRYERPQKGRQRQFTQVGVELLGASSPFADVECIALGYELLKKLKMEDKCHLEINSIGDDESRRDYLIALVEFFNQNLAKLSQDSQRRLKLNPMRILDSKDPQDIALLNQAPKIADFYSQASQDFFSKVCESLKDLKIPFTLNPYLVRGLDYYSHVVFEFKTTHIGAQDAVLSGGRYDQLIQQMGGPHTPSVGWAAGVERLVLLMEAKPKRLRPVCVIPIHDSVEQKAFQIANQIRQSGLSCEIAFSGNLSKRMKKASAQNSWATVLLGPEEQARGEVTLKLMDSGDQRTVALKDVPNTLKDLNKQILESIT